MKLPIAPIAAAIIAMAGVAQAQSAEDLLKKHACTQCHAIDKKVLGPAYNDVAAKYKADPKAATTLFNSVKNGSKDKWGPPPVPMPANDKVPDADIKVMVSYILSLKK